MPALVAALIHALRIMLMAKAGALVLKILLFFGLAITVNRVAIDPVLNQLEGYVAQLGSTGGTMAVAVQWAGLLRFDEALSMLLSAFATAMLIKQSRVFLGISGE